MSRVIDKRAMGPFNLAAEPPVGRDDIAAALGARPVHIPSGVLGALVDLSWRARLQHIDRGWLDMAFTVPLIGLLALSPRTRLGSEMNLDGRLGRCPGWRRAPDSHRQPTFAATLDARSSATRGDRGVDLIASAALSAPTTARGPSIGLIANGSPPPPQRNHHSDRAVGMRLLHIGADRVHPLEMHRVRPRPTWCSVLDLGKAGCSRSRHLPTVGLIVSA